MIKRNFIKASTIAATTLPPVTIALNVKAKKEDSIGEHSYNGQNQKKDVANMEIIII